MPCTTVEELFIEHAQLVRNDVVKSIQDSDFYIKQLPKEPWLDGQGYQYSYPIYERSIITKAVTDSDFFEDFATPDTNPNSHNNLPDDGACAVSSHNIESFGITIRQVTLKKASVNSPDICLDTLRFQWQVMDQIKNITRVLAENTKWVWSNKYQDEYSAACGNKVTAGVGIDDTFDAATPPTSVLSFGILEEVHQELGFRGGNINPSARVEDNTPVYTAVGSLYTFNDLKKKNDNVRSDFQYASAGGGAMQGVLVQDLGIGLGGKVYQGYKFAAVQFPPRWDVVSAAYVRRYPYTSSNATRGKKWEVDDLYKQADYEDTAVYHADVLRVLIPKPGVAAGGMTYQQQYSWAGEFVWRNIPDRTCNIDGNIGFFRALFAYGIKLERPDLGFIIRHLRCDRDLDETDCDGQAT